jgi:hypothetical protein
LARRGWDTWYEKNRDLFRFMSRYILDRAQNQVLQTDLNDYRLLAALYLLCNYLKQKKLKEEKASMCQMQNCFDLILIYFDLFYKHVMLLCVLLYNRWSYSLASIWHLSDRHLDSCDQYSFSFVVLHNSQRRSYIYLGRYFENRSF